MKQMPNVVLYPIEEGKGTLQRAGYKIGDVALARPVHSNEPGNNLRIVRQHSRLDGRVDVVVVYEAPVVTGKEV